MKFYQRKNPTIIVQLSNEANHPNLLINKTIWVTTMKMFYLSQCIQNATKFLSKEY